MSEYFGLARSGINVDPLAAIYNQGQWSLYKVSALYNLQYDVVKLKQYSSKIKQTLASSMTTGATTKYSVSVEAEPTLKYSEEDADALVITVFTVQSENEKPKIVYESLLISWGIYNSVPDAVHLPYMLERGPLKVASAVKSALGNMFDCTITQFNFNQVNLLQFAFKFVQSERSSFDKHINFTYITPRADHKNEVGLKFEIGQVYLMLNSVREEVNTESELVMFTYKTLQNQIIYMFEIDITALELTEISLPKAAVKNNGTVKMKTPEAVKDVFSILNEIISIDLK